MLDRLTELKQWVTDAVGRFEAIAPASEDASFRRYFRIIYPDRTLIVMDAPPDREALAPWLQVRGWLEGADIHVPALVEADPRRGFVAMEDLGTETYASARLNGIPPDDLFADAWDTLVRLQRIEVPADCPPYEARRLGEEMELFWTWLVLQHLGLEFSTRRRQAFEHAKDLLVRRAQAQPQVLIHRDYHSRNLLVTPERSPGVIDFQDAVLGPVSYDVVSLLRDCYVEWPEPDLERWLRHYYTGALAQGVPLPPWATWRVDFDWMGVQRHLKAAGIFARLWHRDGKPGYLADIPRTLGYVARIATRYPELIDLGAWIRAEVLPALAAQDQPVSS